MSFGLQPHYPQSRHPNLPASACKQHSPCLCNYPAFEQLQPQCLCIMLHTFLVQNQVGMPMQYASRVFQLNVIFIRSLIIFITWFLIFAGPNFQFFPSVLRNSLLINNCRNSNRIILQFWAFQIKIKYHKSWQQHCHVIQHFFQSSYRNQFAPRFPASCFSCTLLFLKAPLAIWDPELNVFCVVHLYHTECLLGPQLGDMRYKCGGGSQLRCPFVLFSPARSLGQTAPHIAQVFFDKEEMHLSIIPQLTFQPLGELPPSLSAGVSHLFLCVTQGT